MTSPTGRITGLQSADCIEMIEIQTGGGKIETRVRESCCTVARVYSSYESDAARLRSAPYSVTGCHVGTGRAIKYLVLYDVTRLSVTVPSVSPVSVQVLCVVCVCRMPYAV